MDKKVSKRVEQAIAERVFPGCVIGIVHAEGGREAYPFGTTIYGSAGEKVNESTVYDVASVTKSIPTASLASLFIHERKLSLTDQVRRYLPELKDDHDATIEDLLRYRVEGPRMSGLSSMSPEEITAYVFKHGFGEQPGVPQYTNLPAFFLGLVVERVAADTLDRLSQKYFFDPLGMSSTSFFPNASYMKHCAPTEICEDGKEVRGEPHDESARVFAKAGHAVGHAGLFSTAPNLLDFLEALLAGKYSHIVEGAEKGLGWQVNDPNFMGQHVGPKTFGKTGFTGTSVVCDRERGVAFVILSNRTYPKRPPNGDAINAFRRDIADIILGHT